MRHVCCTGGYNLLAKGYFRGGKIEMTRSSGSLISVKANAAKGDKRKFGHRKNGRLRKQTIEISKQ
jgi:hypothetical protein